MNYADIGMLSGISLETVTIIQNDTYLFKANKASESDGLYNTSFPVFHSNGRNLLRAVSHCRTGSSGCNCRILGQCRIVKHVLFEQFELYEEAHHVMNKEPVNYSIRTLPFELDKAGLL